MDEDNVVLGTGTDTDKVDAPAEELAEIEEEELDLEEEGSDFSDAE